MRARLLRLVPYTWQAEAGCKRARGAGPNPIHARQIGERSSRLFFLARRAAGDEVDERRDAARGGDELFVRVVEGQIPQRAHRRLALLHHPRRREVDERLDAAGLGHQHLVALAFVADLVGGEVAQRDARQGLDRGGVPMPHLRHQDGDAAGFGDQLLVVRVEGERRQRPDGKVDLRLRRARLGDGDERRNAARARDLLLVLPALNGQVAQRARRPFLGLLRMFGFGQAHECLDGPSAVRDVLFGVTERLVAELGGCLELFGQRRVTVGEQLRVYFHFSRLRLWRRVRSGEVWVSSSSKGQGHGGKAKRSSRGRGIETG